MRPPHSTDILEDMRASRLVLAVIAIAAIAGFVVTAQLVSASSPELGPPVRIEPVGDPIEPSATTPPKPSPAATTAPKPTSPATTPPATTLPRTEGPPAAKKVTPVAPEAGLDEDEADEDLTDVDPPDDVDDN